VPGAGHDRHGPAQNHEQQRVEWIAQPRLGVGERVEQGAVGEQMQHGRRTRQAATEHQQGRDDEKRQRPGRAIIWAVYARENPHALSAR
jgi:hypothetical protein